MSFCGLIIAHKFRFVNTFSKYFSVFDIFLLTKARLCDIIPPERFHFKNYGDVKMNKCFNDISRNDGRIYMTAQPRTQEKNALRETGGDMFIALLAAIISIFESAAVKIVIRIVAIAALFVGLFLWVGATEAGILSLPAALIALIAIAAGFAAVLRT